MCIDSLNNQYQCREEVACSNPFGFTTYTSIQSLVTQFEMYCERGYLIELTQGYFITISGLVAFIFGVLSDQIGRRKVFIIGWYFSVIGITVSLVSENLIVITIGNVLSWAGMNTFFSIIFIYSNEISGGSLRQKSNAVLFFFWAFGEIMINVFNIFIHSYKMNYVI